MTVPKVDEDVLFYLGIAFIVLGLVGGGVKYKGLELPTLRALWQYGLAFLIGIGLIVPTLIPDSPFKVTNDPVVTADPPEHTGLCPFRVRFTAQIRTNRAGTVKYVWVRPNGEASEVRSIAISNDNSDAVSTSLLFGSTSDNDREYEGFVYLRVASPSDIVSRGGPYRVTCNP